MMKRFKDFLLSIGVLVTFAFAVNNVQARSYNDSQLASLNFNKNEIITVDHNKPQFSKKTESEKHGPWQKFSPLDFLNRAHTANALLNKKLMPTQKRLGLTWDPTGWHNKRIAGGWLYNRCHLIGYQLTGQNNNPRNLITGTRELNDPDMLKYENKVASYIKQSKKHYIRYRVRPIYRGNNLLANGVEMEAQSIGSNAIHFNIYIFNEQPGVKINYKNGTSRVYKYKAAKRTAPKVVSYSRHHSTKQISTKSGPVIGNRNSKIYHVANGANYHISPKNAVYFNSEAAARAAGYRKSLR